jgi:hypothetical protein
MKGGSNSFAKWGQIFNLDIWRWFSPQSFIILGIQHIKENISPSPNLSLQGKGDFLDLYPKGHHGRPEFIPRMRDRYNTKVSKSTPWPPPAGDIIFVIPDSRPGACLVIRNPGVVPA